MFCKNCGSNVSDGAKFCKVCGSKIQQAEEVSAFETASHQTVQEKTVAEEKTCAEAFPVSQPEPARISLVQSASPSLKSKKPASPARIATVCALSAPIVILLNRILSDVNDLFAWIEDSVSTCWIGDFLNYGIPVVTGLLSVVVTIAVYMLFTFKHRAKLPLFLCLIAPGTSIFISPVSGFIISMIYSDLCLMFIKADWNYAWLDLLINAIYMIFAVIQGVIAFFVLKSVIKKILTNSQPDEAK